MKIDSYLDFLPTKLLQQTKGSLQIAVDAINSTKWPVESIVLSGGWKNQEISYKPDFIASDLDLFVFSNWLPLTWKKLNKIGSQLNARNINPTIHFRGAIPYLLKHSKTFWAYKLKHEGIVISGNPNILDKIQANAHNIPKTEALRMLFNNLAVWLNLIAIKQPRVATYSIIRSYLNIGEAYLTYMGALAPNYTKRRQAFIKIQNQLPLSPEILKRIEIGYNMKSIWRKDLPRTIPRPSLKQAEQDCRTAISQMLADYFPHTQNIDQQLEQLDNEFSSKLIFNLVYYYLTRRVDGVHVKILPLLFKFKITDLYKIVWYHTGQQFHKRDIIIQRYWTISNFSDKTMLQLFELWPIPVTVEAK